MSLCRRLACGLEIFFAQIQGIGYLTTMSEEVTAAMKFISSDAPVVFDVGANRGEWAENFLSRAPARARAYLFEPARANIGIIAEMDDPRVVVVPYAVGDRVRNAVLSGPSSGSTMSSLCPREWEAEYPEVYREEVEVTTIDAFVDQQGIREVDFVKLDIEGHELAALRGASKCIANGIIGACSFEFGPCNIESRTFLRDYWRLFTRAGYRLYRIAPGGLLIPIDKYSGHMEVIRHSNFIAVRDGSRAL